MELGLSGTVSAVFGAAIARVFAAEGARLVAIDRDPRTTRRQVDQTCRKDRWEFPSGSTWIVFNDSASHACLSGQYAFEQTFIISRSRLACPEIAPIAVLEKLAGYPLARIV